MKHYGLSTCGPSAANLSRLGWIPKDRIRTVRGVANDRKVDLVALSHPETPGFLMARILTEDRIYTVEYRQRERRDRALSKDAVVVHELRSYFTMGQNRWGYCRKCQGLAFTGFEAGRCAGGGGHDFSTSGDYSLVSGVPEVKGQEGWKWCRKCQALVHAASGPGRCPHSDFHEFEGSIDYAVPMGETPFAGQKGWRFCKKCKGLAFSATAGPCPGGDSHDLGPTDYTMFDMATSEPWLLGSLSQGERWADLHKGEGVYVDRIDPVSFKATVSV